VIAKNSKAKKIYSNELNREANKYGELNISLNKVEDKVELVKGDIKKVSKKLNTQGCTPKDFCKKSLQGAKFDVIVMPRPNLKDTFLESAFNLSRRGTRIYYYGFCKIGEENKIIEQIKEEALKAKKKIKILKIKKAGEIAPYKTRLRIDFLVK
jgi:tRNA (guanine37-N1)-methyltransferase